MIQFPLNTRIQGSWTDDSDQSPHHELLATAPPLAPYHTIGLPTQPRTWKALMYLTGGDARAPGEYTGEGVWLTNGEKIDYTRIACFDMYS